MNKPGRAIAVLFAALLLGGCSGPSTEQSSMQPAANTAEIQSKAEVLVEAEQRPGRLVRTVTPNRENVADAYDAVQRSGMELEGGLYEVMTDSLSGTEYHVVKDSSSGASFLLYQGNTYQLGEYFGGYGVLDLETADLNGDGREELYFTYSWGSGMTRSQFGCFDPAQKAVCCPETSLGYMDLALMKEGSRLFLERAEWDGEMGQSDCQITAFERIAELSFQNGKLETSPQLPFMSCWILGEGLISAE